MKKYAFALIEGSLWFFAVSSLLYYSSTLWANSVRADKAIKSFEQRVVNTEKVATTDEIDYDHELPKSVALWSQEALADFNNAEKSQVPLALIAVPRLQLEVPVFTGTTEEQLDIGAGWLPSTAEITDPNGNIAIAAHRDSWFRPLKDIRKGDVVSVTTTSGLEQYTVTGTQVVTPEDTSVLAHSRDKQLTLITCYPFYFVGNAPYRFVVTARKNHT
ncbi:class D sortase [Pseudoalteromonas sp. YIC-656]|uniref:class D sortase n=1 Tax=Pseudoalteromonas pernae TaxID=3118054 RepID=UPI003241FA20